MRASWLSSTPAHSVWVILSPYNTDAGALDCLGTPSGTHGYADLMTSAAEVELEDGLRVIASLDD